MPTLILEGLAILFVVSAGGYLLFPWLPLRCRQFLTSEVERAETVMLNPQRSAIVNNFTRTAVQELRLNSVEPSVCSSVESTTVIIHGSGFTSASRASLSGGIQCILLSASERTLIIIVPSCPVGTIASLIVVNLNYQAELPDALHYEAPPTIVGVSTSNELDNAAARSGTELAMNDPFPCVFLPLGVSSTFYVYGFNFTALSVVKIEDLVITTEPINDRKLKVATFPQSCVGHSNRKLNLIVVNRREESINDQNQPGLISDVLKGAVCYGDPPPLIEAVYKWGKRAPATISSPPLRLPMCGGALISIHGKNFQPDSSVIINGVACSEVYWFSPYKLSCILPPSLCPGVVGITVRNRTGLELESSPLAKIEYRISTFKDRVFIIGGQVSNIFATHNQEALSRVMSVIAGNIGGQQQQGRYQASDLGDTGALGFEPDLPVDDFSVRCIACLSEATELESGVHLLGLTLCPHRVCSTCLPRQVSHMIEHNQIKCEARTINNHACRAPFALNYLQRALSMRLISEELLQRVERMMVKEALPAQVFMCPVKGCRSCQYLPTGFVPGRARCLENHLVCTRCDIPWHTDLTCDQYIEQQQRNQQAHEAAIVASDLMIRTSSKPCPGCGTRTTHFWDHGCHHIKPGIGCPTCHRHWCYKCGTSYGGTDMKEKQCNCQLFCTDDCGCPHCEQCEQTGPCGLCDINCRSCAIRERGR